MRSGHAAMQVAWDANGVCTHHDSVPGTMMNSASLKGSCPRVMALLNAYVHHLSPPPTPHLCLFHELESNNTPLLSFSYDQCERCTTPDCQVLEDYRARLWEAEAGLSDIITQSLQIISGTAATPTFFPPPPPAPPAAAYIIYNPVAHDRMELVNLCVLQFAVSCASCQPLHSITNTCKQVFHASCWLRLRLAYVARCFWSCSSGTTRQRNILFNIDELMSGPNWRERDLACHDVRVHCILPAALHRVQVHGFSSLYCSSPLRRLFNVHSFI
jgi:hypothetical protein